MGLRFVEQHGKLLAVLAGPNRQLACRLMPATARTEHQAMGTKRLCRHSAV